MVSDGSCYEIVDGPCATLIDFQISIKCEVHARIFASNIKGKNCEKVYMKHFITVT